MPVCGSWPILIDQLTDEFRTANDIGPPARGVHPSALIKPCVLRDRLAAAPTLPPDSGIGDYRELAPGRNLSFCWHHLQLWAEFYEARFEVPRVGNADTFSYYFEAKCKITPQLFCARRSNQQLFGTVRDEDHSAKWGNDIWRIDAALGYRFTDYLQGKVQYSFSHEDSLQEGDNLFAAQLTLKF